MHEYEFRIVIQDSSSFLPFLQFLGYPIQKQVVYYVKPHFRCKNKTIEKKRASSILSVYHDGLWFKWVHSIETPYRNWSRNTMKTFLHNIGNYQDPINVELRDFVQIDSRAQLYTFRNGKHYRLVFEWEYGTFKKPLTKFNGPKLLRSLSKYKLIYDHFRYCESPYRESPLQENITRKPVKSISHVPDDRDYLYAHKLDGTFGLVFSYKDRIQEKWEGYEYVERRNVTLGNGLVFAAEKMEDGKIFLLDVYQFQGHETAGWSRREILLRYLPSLKLIDGYYIQTYVTSKELLLSPSFKTDGIIVHDVKEDTIYKYKTNHSIDLLYLNGYFHLPYGKIKCSETKNMEDGCVYEISTSDGRVMRKRSDRFKGNTEKQLKDILAYGWHGPPIEL